MWASNTLRELIVSYGYGLVALAAALEGMGIPVPGETVLVLAAIYAGVTGQLSIVYIVLAAAGGAIVGDNVGYWIGRELGRRILLRGGRRFLLTERRIRLGQYLFARHGGKVVYFARFFTVLRTLGAFLAGCNRMSWGRFVIFNGAGGMTWALAFGIAAYLLGDGIHQVLGPLGIASLVLVACVAAAALVVLRRRERAWERAAMRGGDYGDCGDGGSRPPPSARKS
jgi:membrane protein DedA with SNARE-associated domain